MAPGLSLFQLQGGVCKTSPSPTGSKCVFTVIKELEGLFS